MSAELIRAGRSLADFIHSSVDLVDDRDDRRRFQAHSWPPSRPACIPAQPLDALVEWFKSKCPPGPLTRLKLELETRMGLARSVPDDGGPARYVALRIDRRWVDELERELSHHEPAVIARGASPGQSRSLEPPGSVPDRQDTKGTHPLQGDPAAQAIAAAYALHKAGKAVSVRAACEKAGVDRNHLAKKYPETIALIKQLAVPDRKPSSGAIDRRTGNLDAYDDADDD